MIGSNTKSWNWLYNAVVPALVAVVEACWVAAWISALAHTAHDDRVDVPFLALALPAIIALVLSGCITRLAWPQWCRTGAVAITVLVGTGISAGVVGALYLHGSFGAIGVDPWTVSGATPGEDAALAWLVASLAWARGTWLGREELTLGHALNAVGIATFAFVLFFVVGSIARHDAAFRAEIGPAAVLLLISFPAAMTVIALVHERDLERYALRHRRSRPSPAWLGAVVIPMLGVAVVALVLALAVGPLASFVGSIARDLVRAVGAVIGYLARWLARLFPERKLPSHPAVGVVPISHLPRAAAGNVHVPLWIWLVTGSLGALVCAGLLYFGVRALIRFILRLRAPHRGAVQELDEDRDSVFSWRHLLDQILDALRKMARRSRGGGAAAGAPGGSAEWATTGQPSARDSIRRHYRAVLVAARTAGYGRYLSETPLELEGRISAVTGDPAEAALREITAAYERARYGGGPGDEREVERAGQNADLLVTSLLDIADDAGSRAAPEGE